MSLNVAKNAEHTISKMSGTMDVVSYNVQALCKLVAHVSYKQMHVISSFLIIDSIVSPNA